MGLFLGGVGELVARGADKPEVLVPQSLLKRPHRALCLMKGLKKDKNSHQGTRTDSGIT